MNCINQEKVRYFYHLLLKDNQLVIGERGHSSLHDRLLLYGQKRTNQNRKRPDLVIEVVVSSGGIDKLEAYKRKFLKFGFGLMMNYCFIF